MYLVYFTIAFDRVFCFWCSGVRNVLWGFSLLVCVGFCCQKKGNTYFDTNTHRVQRGATEKKHAQEFRNKHRNKETKSSNNNTPTTTTTATTYLRSTSMAWKSNRQRERKPSQPPTTTTTNATTTAIQEPRKNESKSTCQPSQMRTCKLVSSCVFAHIWLSNRPVPFSSMVIFEAAPWAGTNNVDRYWSLLKGKPCAGFSSVDGNCRSEHCACASAGSVDGDCLSENPVVMLVALTAIAWANALSQG